VTHKKLLITLTASALALTTLGALLLWGSHALQRRALAAAAYPPPPQGMVFVPPGDFLLGNPDPKAPADEGPLRTTFLQAFYIDKYEVTHAQYKVFYPAHEIPPGQDQFPVTGLSLEEARAYARGVGKRLPTAAEWEKAARGTDGRAYPWGNEFKEGLANLGGRDGLMAVGSVPEGASPCGALDMTGNAWEWVDTPYVQRNLFGQALYTTEIIKGGGYSYAPFQGRAFHNGFEGIGGTCNDVGFRCAQTAVPVD
jgi:formylglycine-generating enzyme required for sulfatase activity